MALQFYCYHRLYQTASSMLFGDVVKEDGVYALAANAQHLGTECRLKKVIPMAGRTELFREMGDFRRAGKIEGLSIDPTNDRPRGAQQPQKPNTARHAHRPFHRRRLHRRSSRTLRLRKNKVTLQGSEPLPLHAVCNQS